MREVLRAWTRGGEGGEGEGEARESGSRRQTSQPCRTICGRVQEVHKVCRGRGGRRAEGTVEVVCVRSRFVRLFSWDSRRASIYQYSHTMERYTCIPVCRGNPMTPISSLDDRVLEPSPCALIVQDSIDINRARTLN